MPGEQSSAEPEVAPDWQAPDSDADLDQSLEAELAAVMSDTSDTEWVHKDAAIVSGEGAFAGVAGAAAMPPSAHEGASVAHAAARFHGDVWTVHTQGKGWAQAGPQRIQNHSTNRDPV